MCLWRQKGKNSTAFQGKSVCPMNDTFIGILFHTLKKIFFFFFTQKKKHFLVIQNMVKRLVTIFKHFNMSLTPKVKGAGSGGGAEGAVIHWCC